MLVGRRERRPGYAAADRRVVNHLDAVPSVAK
jgi:hypothetical protein